MHLSKLFAARKRVSAMSMDKTKSKLLQRAFHEVKHNEPRIVGKTRKKKGSKAAQRQKIAIALSKAREAGANV